MPSTILGDQALSLPNGTQANRPAGASLGTMRYNTTGNNAEVLTAQGWASFGELPGYSLSAPAESAAAIQSANPAATNGFYWIRQTGSTAYQTYCVFTDFNGSAIQGGPWTVGFKSGLNNTTLGNGSAGLTDMISQCSTIGINTPGRGMESSRTTTEVYGAWLAVKRTIWNAYSSYVNSGNQGGGSVLFMPMISINGDGGGKDLRLAYDSSRTTHIPPNNTGDSCDSTEQYCGWWSSTDISTWHTNNNVIPGPEDWARGSSVNSTYSGNGLSAVVLACVYR